MKSTSTQLQDEQPWARPWWQFSKGNGPTFFYLIFIHVLAIIGFVLFPLPGWQVLIAALILTAIGGVGTTVCYHRSLSHRALRLHTVVENLLIFFTLFNASSEPM